MKKKQLKPMAPQAKQAAVAPKIFSWRRFTSKLLLLLVAVTAVVIYTDKKEYFTADQRNNHVERKWRSFYRFTKRQKKEVDMVIFGNSNAMAGVEPFIISISTGTYCFILGTPGSAIIDTWFGLNEVLRYAKPKLVILETSFIYSGEVGQEWSRIQSFEAKENTWYKLVMMPYLFKSDDWVKAWSPTVRNHSFLLTDQERIAFNKKTKNKNPDRMQLDLGRFAHGYAHLEDSTIAKYDILGAPVDGRNTRIAEQNQKYLKKVADLCRANDISLMFLTTPLYYRTYDHYDARKAVLNAEFQKYPEAKWLNLQSPYDTLSYTKEAFENDFGVHHSTSYGMEITAYKLAAFLSDNYAAILPDRQNDQTWLADLSTHNHFAFNRDIIPSMSDFESVLKDKTVGAFHIREMVVQKTKEANRLILKVDRNPALTSSMVAT
ncbi:MAG: hypothetical protein LBV39_02285, partial [Bacteroidales bacterium]|nr:hypothetical protein [Bacteroidales bacterium]